MFDLRDLTVPIIGAPMAGGPGTPALAAAVSNAGGLGFLAAGYLTGQRFADDIVAARLLTSGPIGVNLFVPQPSAATRSALDEYRDRLTPLVQRFGVELGLPRLDDDGWDEKLDVVVSAAPELASFTFGCPSPDVLARLRRAGVVSAVTVTSRAEADVAVAAGADVLVVQGPDAGGHRGTFSPIRRPGEASLGELLTEIAKGGETPVVAAGGLSAQSAIQNVLDRGAVAAQVGTALLLSDEAGTNPVHRAALKDDQFTETVVTRAFSGRYARGLANEFTRRFDPVAPLGYPDVNQLTGPLRAAAVAAGDSQNTNLWAGTQWRKRVEGPARDIVAALAPAQSEAEDSPMRRSAAT